MNEEDKELFDLTITSVNNMLTIILSLFKAAGIKGMKELIDPSFEDLRDQITEMRQRAYEYEKELTSLKTSTNSVSALRFMQNIKQGILFTENLMISIKDEDLDTCLKTVSEIEKMNITSPAWD